MGAGGEGDQDVEVQIAQLVRLESLVVMDSCEDLPGLKPVVLGGSEDWPALFNCPDKLPVRFGCCPTPKLRQNNGRVSNPSRSMLEPLSVARCALIVDQNRRVEDDDLIHRNRRT